jgi:hypothetical protein
MRLPGRMTASSQLDAPQGGGMLFADRETYTD